MEADLDEWDLGTENWDLVTVMYPGGDSYPHWLERIKASVGPGGLVIAELFHMAEDEDDSNSGFKSGQLAAAFVGWNIVRDEVVTGDAEWWRISDTKLLRFVAKKPASASPQL